MHTAVTEPQKPRLGLVAVLAANVVAGPLGVVVGRITIDVFSFDAIEGQQLIGVIIARVCGVFWPIPDDLIVPVTAEARIDAGVPLANLGRVIAGLAKLRRP